MAITVQYFKDTNDCYSQGPFVMVYANGWRVEVGNKTMKCPVLPDISIYTFIKSKGLPDGKTKDQALMSCIIDYLNAKVKDGTLPLNKAQLPYWPDHEVEMLLQMNKR